MNHSHGNENDTLKYWEDNRVFQRLQERNAAGPKFLLLDGPITANNPMGVHHAWGRTVKDYYQRYYGLRGYRQRYQNGFDCQGLWVEVEVEKALGLNSKQELLDFGLDNFADECKKRVAHYAAVQTEQSKRLGQWMNWEDSYYTMSDTNIEYNWLFLNKCHEQGLLYRDNRLMRWCGRCSTSLSQHEQADSYVETTHTAAYVFFKLQDKSEYLLAWTTQPWTLAANMALGVDPGANYVCVDLDGRHTWMLETSPLADKMKHLKSAPGREFLDLLYEPLFNWQQGLDLRVLPMSVDQESGTGVVHLAPACGEEDWELGKEHGLVAEPVLDEQGRFLTAWGPLAGQTWQQASDWVLTNLANVYRSERYTHRYPTCWRCKSELTFRLSEEWFLRTTALRERLMQANEDVKYKPAYYKKRMVDWLNNMGDWCISRKRYWGLPLPFYYCNDCDHLTMVKSKEELERLSGQKLRELHRPYLDDAQVPCESCHTMLDRVEDVGDCWLDAGVVPFSTLGYNNTDSTRMYATGASEGLSGASLPTHDRWQEEFRADLVVEMREQIRLWFYSMLVMSVVNEGVAPYKEILTYEKVMDKNGDAMHKSHGNAINFDDAVNEVGADALRFMYLSQAPTQNLRFDYDRAHDVTKSFLTLRNVVKFYQDYRQGHVWDGSEPGSEEYTDRWLCALTHRLVQNIDEAVAERDHSRACVLLTQYLDSLSNTYVRMNRRRFWDADRSAQDTLAWALRVYLQLLSPAMPFLTEELYLQMGGPEDSVHLLPWPKAQKYDPELLETMEQLERVLQAGRGLRSTHNLPLRQPLGSVRLTRDVYNKLLPLKRLVCEQLNVKELEVEEENDWEKNYKLNLPVVGPRYGSLLRSWDLGSAREEGGGLRVSSEVVLKEDEYYTVLSTREGLVGDEATGVMLDTSMTPELAREGLMRNALRALQDYRKQSGYDVMDKVKVSLYATGELAFALAYYQEYLANELLAREFTLLDNPIEGLVQVAHCGSDTLWASLQPSNNVDQTRAV
jgi:isoleucyl-tRNA synthetase